jgi:hypothetical protein
MDFILRGLISPSLFESKQRPQEVLETSAPAAQLDAMMNVRNMCVNHLKYRDIYIYILYINLIDLHR